MLSIRTSKSDSSLSFLRSACIDAGTQGVFSVKSFDGSIACNPLTALSYSEFRPSLVNTLLSIPIMNPITNVVKKYNSLDTSEGLENELICVLTDAMQDPSNPWSQLVPRSPPVLGSRTPEQYLAAIDVAINARKEMNRSKMIAKYWKQQALRDVLPNEDSVPLTPSPSDISVSVSSEHLSSSRRERLNELIARRGAVSYTGCNLDSGAAMREVDDLSASLRALELAEKCSAAHLAFCADPIPISGTGCISESDVTLVNPKEATVPNVTKIPALKKQSSLPASPDNTTQVISTPPPTKLSSKTHTCCKTPGTVQSTPRLASGVLTSVQSKRQLYESLASRPFESPVLASTPSAKPRPLRPRKSSVETAQSRPVLTTERKVTSKLKATTQRRTSASSNDLQRSAQQPKPSGLRHVRRQIKASS